MQQLNILIADVEFISTNSGIKIAVPAGERWQPLLKSRGVASLVEHLVSIYAPEKLRHLRLHEEEYGWRIQWDFVTTTFDVPKWRELKGCLSLVAMVALGTQAIDRFG